MIPTAADLGSIGAVSTFPIIGEPTSSEFNHECREGESDDLIFVNRDPVINQVIFKTAKDPRNF